MLRGVRVRSTEHGATLEISARQEFHIGMSSKMPADHGSRIAIVTGGASGTAGPPSTDCGRRAFAPCRSTSARRPRSTFRRRCRAPPWPRSRRSMDRSTSSSTAPGSVPAGNWAPTATSTSGSFACRQPHRSHAGRKQLHRRSHRVGVGTGCERGLDRGAGGATGHRALHGGQARTPRVYASLAVEHGRTGLTAKLHLSRPDPHASGLGHPAGLQGDLRPPPRPARAVRLA